MSGLGSLFGWHFGFAIAREVTDLAAGDVALCAKHNARRRTFERGDLREAQSS